MFYKFKPENTTPIGKSKNGANVLKEETSPSKIIFVIIMLNINILSDFTVLVLYETLCIRDIRTVPRKTFPRRAFPRKTFPRRTVLRKHFPKSHILFQE